MTLHEHHYYHKQRTTMVTSGPRILTKGRIARGVFHPQIKNNLLHHLLSLDKFAFIYSHYKKLHYAKSISSNYYKFALYVPSSQVLGTHYPCSRAVKRCLIPPWVQPVYTGTQAMLIGARYTLLLITGGQKASERGPCLPAAFITRDHI